MQCYPVCLQLSGKRCLLVGGGKVALTKARALRRSGASVVVVSPDFAPGFEDLSGITLRARSFEEGDLDGIFLAIAATNDADVNRTVSEACRSRGILCNVVDTPASSDFYDTATVVRGSIVVSVSTCGAAPALAKRLRGELEEWLPEEYTEYVAFLHEARDRAKQCVSAPGERSRIATELASREGWQRFAQMTESEREDWLTRLLKEGTRGNSP